MVHFAEGQWLFTKNKTVLFAHAGSNFGFTSTQNAAFYQLSAGAMHYTKRRLAWGGEAAFSQLFGQYRNLDIVGINAFGHFKMPLGLYAEGGLGITGSVSDGRSQMPSNAGFFYSLGWAKSLGPKLAFDIQYRKAPSLGINEFHDFQKGLRLGILVKI